MGSTAKSTTININSITDKNKPTTTTDDPAELCSICAIEPAATSDVIPKDNNYQQMLKLYFEALEVDVKPGEISKQSICTSCFDLLVEFYDTNDILLILEKELKNAKLRLVETVEKGIQALQKDGKGISLIQKRISDKLPEVKTTLQIKQEKLDAKESGKDQDYTFRTFLKQSRSGSGSSKQANGSKEKEINAESSDTDTTHNNTKKNPGPSTSSGASTSKRRRHESSEDVSDSERRIQKAKKPGPGRPGRPPAVDKRIRPARNVKSKTPTYNLDSDEEDE